MYAILQQSGHQYRVSPGDRLVVDRLAAEVGSVVALEPVVLVAGDDGTQVGTPVVDGARIAAVVVSHRKGAKIRVFKYKPKKRYRRTHGHRSALTELRVEAVLAAGEPLPEAPKPAEKKPAATAAVEKPARSRSRAPKAEVQADAADDAATARRRAKPAAPAAEAETPEAWGSGEAPDAEADATAAKAAATKATADAEPEASETPAAEAGDEAAPAEKPKRTRTRKSPAAEGGDTAEA